MNFCATIHMKKRKQVAYDNTDNHHPVIDRVPPGDYICTAGRRPDRQKPRGLSGTLNENNRPCEVGGCFIVLRVQAPRSSAVLLICRTKLQRQNVFVLTFSFGGTIDPRREQAQQNNCL